MANSKLVLGAVAALALGVAGPAFAQTSASANTTGASGDHSNTSVKNVNKTLTYSPALTYSPSESLSESYANSSQHTYTNSSQRNGNIHLVADQTLDASISNESALNFSGHGDFGSGSNSVNGSAFAAYSGILNQGWNTGVNSNTQAATNIAAQGTTSFATH